MHMQLQFVLFEEKVDSHMNEAMEGKGWTFIMNGRGDTNESRRIYQLIRLV